MPDNLDTHLLRTVVAELRLIKAQGERAMAQVSDEEFFATIDPESNSLAVIVKHLAGNMRSRWTNFLTSDGEKPDRHRDDEFVIGPQTTRAEVMAWWEEGWRVTFAALESLQPDDLIRTVLIRQAPHSVVQAVSRQITHYAGHVGQMVFLAKHLRSSGWQTLSIPRGQSEAFDRKLRERSGR